ncbi:MAG: amino acid ABC transporter permease [Clostridia bacterium]|nr:amino acid ABC transporter permease [Clostridia bacterium]
MSERIIGILTEGLGKMLLASIKVTIPLTIIGFACAMLIALIMAMVQYAKVPVLSQLSRLYIWVFRGTPLLVQLFLAFYGLPKLGIVLDAFPCAVIVFSLNEGAYCAETMRAALEAVPAGQVEAGYCIGLSYVQIMAKIVLPQAMRTAFPSLSNNLISMLKDTSLAAEITVADMFMAAQKIVGRTYEAFWLYAEVALIYLFYSTILTLIQRRLEKKLSAYNSREAAPGSRRLSNESD